ncbi:MAG: S-layer homology domain-containing protein, partial [Firmicutes bacterium]|nr:S-layer homology domain-containing protein [Bacillota bacterium]
MITLIAHVLNRGEIPAATKACVFTDVTDASLVNAVMWAYEQKVVMGTGETKFNPDANITMQHAYFMVLRAMGYTKFSSVDVYAIDKNLKEKKLDDTVTYSDAATLLYNMLSCPKSGGSMLMETLYGKKELKVVTFNSKCTYSEEEDGINFFFHRIGMVVDKINKENPDVICFQEIF